MNQDQQRKFENHLLVSGLAGLTEPEQIMALGRLIPDGGFLAGLLNEVPLSHRREMYEAIVPHLRFKPLSYEHYANFFKRKAEAIASDLSPIIVGDSRCVVTFKCFGCNRKSKYRGDTPVQAVCKARTAGWVRDPGLHKEMCKKCTAGRPN